MAEVVLVVDEAHQEDEVVTEEVAVEEEEEAERWVQRAVKKHSLYVSLSLRLRQRGLIIF